MSFFELVGQGLVAYILVRLGIYLSKAQLSIPLHPSIFIPPTPIVYGQRCGAENISSGSTETQIRIAALATDSFIRYL
jgi:hypothetical protein